MNSILNLTLFLSSLLKFSQQIYISKFELEFQKNVPFANYSLVPNTNIVKQSKHICLSRCSKNDYCSFAIYNQGNCSLHTEYALSRLISSELNIVYKKKFIIE